MAARDAPLGWRCCSAGAGIAAAALVVAFLSAGTASAQSSRPQAMATAAAASAPDRPAEPDVFDRIGRWFDRSIGNFNDGVKDTFGGFDQFGDRMHGALKGAARDVTGSVGSPVLPNIVSKRQRCEPAANGAPDCRRAAEAACRSSGYARGRSLQTQSEQVCSLPRLFSQEASKPHGCRTETHVLRSICR